MTSSPALSLSPAHHGIVYPLRAQRSAERARTALLRRGYSTRMTGYTFSHPYGPTPRKV